MTKTDIISYHEVQTGWHHYWWLSRPITLSNITVPLGRKVDMTMTELKGIFVGYRTFCEISLWCLIGYVYEIVSPLDGH